jgi:hypothetical protein
MIAVGNFGGNHRADLAILTTQGTLTLLLNDGEPGQLSFTEVDLPALPPTVQTIVDMKTGDLNNDGMDDLVISYQSGPGAGGVAVILDPADPSKRTITTYPLANFNGLIPAGGLAIRDVNGDGKLDVVVNAGPLKGGNIFPTFSVALGDGQGNLGAWHYYSNPSGDSGPNDNRTVSLGDIRQNGSQDAVLFNANASAGTYSIDLFLNQGGGVYTQQQHLLDETLYKYHGTVPVAADLVDVNGDLKPDLVLLFPGTGNQGDGGAFVVFLNTGAAPYFDTSNPLVFPIDDNSYGDSNKAQFMAVADLNNDGLNDLLALSVGPEGTETLINRFFNTTAPNPPNQPVTLTYGQTISNGNDFVNVQLPSSNGLGSAPTPQQPPADNAVHCVHDPYRKILQREAEAAGRASWVGLLNSGVPRSTMVQAIWESLEQGGLPVDQLYGHDLDRVADPQGRTSWVKALLNGVSETEASRGFLTREEYRQAHADTTASLNARYADVLDGSPDASGLDAWQQAALGGLSRGALADGFLQSPEQAKLLVDQNYARYLVRPTDVPGDQAWVGALFEHRLTKEQITQAFLASDENFSPAGATGGTAGA